MSKLTLADLGATSVSFELKHPKSGEDLGVQVELVGPDSAEFRDLAKAHLIKHSNDKKSDIEASLTQGELLLATCVVGWSDDEFFGGAYSRDRVLSIIRDPKLRWLREQLDIFTNERTNFFR